MVLLQILFREWPNILSLLAGLIAIKTLIITAIGPRVGLTLQESIRIGFLLSQGGEFAFVVFSLANRLAVICFSVHYLAHSICLLLLMKRSIFDYRLGVLPLELNKLLIIVVVLSMSLTPLLNEIGREAANFVAEKFAEDDVRNYFHWFPAFDRHYYVKNGLCYWCHLLKHKINLIGKALLFRKTVYI